MQCDNSSSRQEENAVKDGNTNGDLKILFPVNLLFLFDKQSYLSSF